MTDTSSNISPDTVYASPENPPQCRYQSSQTPIDVNDFHQAPGYYESGIYQSVFHPHYQANDDEEEGM